MPSEQHGAVHTFSSYLTTHTLLPLLTRMFLTYHPPYIRCSAAFSQPHAVPSTHLTTPRRCAALPFAAHTRRHYAAACRTLPATALARTTCLCTAHQRMARVRLHLPRCPRARFTLPFNCCAPIPLHTAFARAPRAPAPPTLLPPRLPPIPATVLPRHCTAAPAASHYRRCHTSTATGLRYLYFYTPHLYRACQQAYHQRPASRLLLPPLCRLRCCARRISPHNLLVCHNVASPDVHLLTRHRLFCATCLNAARLPRRAAPGAPTFCQPAPHAIPPLRQHTLSITILTGTPL